MCAIDGPVAEPGQNRKNKARSQIGRQGNESMRSRLIGRWMDDQSNVFSRQGALYICKLEGNTPSHILSINPTDSSPLRQLIRYLSRSCRSY